MLSSLKRLFAGAPSITIDELDRRILSTIIEKFGGGPVGVNSIAAAISEERDEIGRAHV